MTENRRLFLTLLLVILLNCSDALLVALNQQKQRSWSRFKLEMTNPQSSSTGMSSLIKRSVLVATLIPSLTLADPQAPTVKTMESAVVALEQSQGRDDTLRALDNLYSTAETKSSIVKAKYKYRIVNDLKEKRIEFSDKWDSDLSIATEEVRRRIDPYHSVDIADYLKIAPVVGGLCYLGALVIQNIMPELFLFAYPIAVGVFLSPIIFKILTS